MSMIDKWRAAWERFTSARNVTSAAVAVSLAALALASPTPALAEGKIRVAEQFGVTYLMLNVAREQKLVEKYGREQGVDIDVEWLRLSGGAAVNDALLSGSVDIAGAGVGPLLTIWDRTKGRQNVRGVASLGNFPYYLVSNNPAVKTIKDLTDRDRIALPAVGVSVQARVLQLASSKVWGADQYNKLDSISVALPHPDAAAAVISGGTEITAHFGSPPFQEQELAGNKNARIVLNSYDVLGGPSSATLLFATDKFRAQNPKTYQAFQDALVEAARFITEHPDQAADIYLKVTGAKLDRDFLIGVIKNPDVQFKVQPQNTYALAEFMHSVGAIKNKPASWKDYFFDDALIANGG